MKPKDLKSIFNWETRKPLLKEMILYVPDYYFEHQSFIMPKLSEIFCNDNSVIIEYCSGNGDWIVEKAHQHPEKNFIAVEKLFERVRKIYSKRENLGLKNLLIVCGEAHTFTKYYLNQTAIQEIYINFPDPWPKLRHAKHRLIKKEFTDELTRILNNNGSLTVVTDDEGYSNGIIEMMLKEPLWKSAYASPYFITDVQGYGHSFFEALWRKKGKIIRHLQFLNLKEKLS